MAKESREYREIDRTYSRIRRRKAFRKKRILLLTAVLLPLLAAACFFAYRQYTKPRAVMPSAGTAVIRFLDVGQGDAMLIRTERSAVLIDAGDRDHGALLVHMLREAGTVRLSCIVCSHPHSDHIGGLPAVLEQFPADEICLPEMPEALLPTNGAFLDVLDIAAEKQIPVHTPECGEKRQFDGLTAEFLCTDNSAYEDLNNCSLGVRLDFGSVSLFAAGDLEGGGEDAFLSAGLLRPADILKVSHHGAAKSTLSSFLNAVNPKTAVISCGAFNDYGHPSVKTLQRLHDAGCAVYRTDIDGTVCIVTDGTQYTVTAENRSAAD